MADNTNINISITSELKRYLDQEVAEGDYASISEIVREALRLHRKYRSEVGYKRAFLAEVQDMVHESLKEYRHGKYEEYGSGAELVDALLREKESK
jgi:putative addiction module CopG family antidote